jgi:ring-1,2-phenylacetyl-CoA epoxidase subunit PaaB
MESLDPRINRLESKGIWEDELRKEGMDQFETYEVFLQLRENRPFEHVGIMHAPNEELALIFGKEQYSRRYTCTGIFVVRTDNVKVTRYTENEENVYENVDLHPYEGGNESFEIFHLKKRGKQHTHMGTVQARDYEDALAAAYKEFYSGSPVYNIWVVRSEHILSIEPEDKVIWNTLPEKKFRDAIAYKAGDKIKEFKERNS